MGRLGDLLEERHRCRLTLPELAPGAMHRVLETLREAAGEEPEVDHPRKDLEQFFLEVVEKARRGAEAPSGVGASGGVATYLAPAAGEAPARPAPAPGDAPAGADADARLRRLVGPGPGDGGRA
jgi:hypothetical protein